MTGGVLRAALLRGGAGHRAELRLPLVDAPVKQIDVAQEVEHERVRRVVVDLVGRPDLLDLALVHHDHPVRDLQRLLLVVRDEDAGDVQVVVQAAQPAAQVLADLGVQRAERLVQQQHLRLHGQRPRQRHPLPLPAGSCDGNRFASPSSCTICSRDITRSVISALDGRNCRGRTRRPNAMFSKTLMCRNSA